MMEALLHPPACFIDTNIFLSCLIEEFDEVSNRDVFVSLKNLLDYKRIVILLPENIKREIMVGINEKYADCRKKLADDFIKMIDRQEKNKIAKIFTSAFVKAKITAEIEIDKHEKDTETLLDSIFNHINTKLIKIDNEILLKAIKRAALKLPPAYSSSKEMHYLKDYDSIAYEAIKAVVLADEKIKKLVICTNDGDYYKDKKIDPRIAEDFNIKNGFEITGYKDLSRLLGEEFGIKITQNIPITETIIDNNALPINSIITSSGSSYLCWYGSDKKRYFFTTPGAFFSWFPNPAETPARIELTDEQMVSIPIGGNITYRPGTRMVKIKTDPKIYAVSNGAILRWICSAKVASEIYGEDWFRYVDVIPDAFFVNYSTGKDIESPTDYDPKLEIASSRLP